jgi:hypothetical protein|tara:strand:- start:87 stop:683 length:597 start_codon:yes stop_codon:yes gene_type:complete
MALQSSGQISLDDIHVEAGGTTGTQAAINDSDIRGLISASSASEMEFADFYGASSGYSATLLTGTQTYIGAINTSSTITSTPITYANSATLSDQTFDPGNQGIASSSSVSTPGYIRAIFSNRISLNNYLDIYCLTALSNTGFTTIRSTRTGHDVSYNRVDATFTTTISSSPVKGYARWRWPGTRLFPDFSTTYTVSIT